MMKLVTVDQMLAIEKEADAAGLTYARMMENAGAGLAQIIQDLQLDTDAREILGLVGPGNNGGDTLVALAALAASGWQARAYLVKRNPDTLADRLQKAGGQIFLANKDPQFKNLSSALNSTAVVLDGLLGTGTKPPVRGEVATVMAKTNQLLGGQERPPYVIAVDCPSGLDCDTGETPDDCIPADLTVTMAAVKRGLLKEPAYEFVGDLKVVDIGLPPDLSALLSVRTTVVDETLVAKILPRRSPFAHKGTFGTSLIAAGSVNYTGAALLAASAAYRVGAGLVTLAVPTPLHTALAGQLPEATWLLLPHELGVISREASDVLIDALPNSTGLLVGPGLGTEATTGDFIQRLLVRETHVLKSGAPMGFVGTGAVKEGKHETTLPAMVIDADGLKLLSRINDWHKLLPASSVLTPHPGEMSVLTGLPKEEILQDRSAVAERFAKAWGHVVVLKGAFTVAAAPDGETSIIPIASASLARAGTGDVLAGAIVGLIAQGIPPYQAALAGAWIHAQAGLYAARRLGNDASVVAGDVLDALAEVISDLPD